MHVTWRAGVVADLHARVELFTSGRWSGTTPAMRLEADAWWPTRSRGVVRA